MDIVTLITNLLLVSLPIVMFFFYQMRKPITQVDQLRPRDRRFEQLTVSKETDLSLHCKKSGGDFWRFIKLGTAWMGNIKGRTVTKFFGVEMRAFTTVFADPDSVQLTIPEFLRDVWGEVFYGTIPAPQRRKIEDGKVGVTIEPIQTFSGLYEEISAEQINAEDEKIILGGIAGTIKKTTKEDLYKAAMPFILGAMTMYFVIKQGYLP